MNVIMVMMMIMMVMVMVTEGNKIELTCKATPDFNLCVSLLKSDSKGVSADTSGLALIIINKIKVFSFIFQFSFLNVYIANYLDLNYLFSSKN